MKKIIVLFASLVFTSMIVTSCLNDDNSNTADINYIGKVDSIVYSQPQDSVWNYNICEALMKMEILYTTFNVKDTITVGYASNAISSCDYKAACVLDAKLKKVTLSEIKKTIYNNHADSLIKLGYVNGSEELPIRQFKLHPSLWSFYTGSQVCYFEYNIK